MKTHILFSLLLCFSIQSIAQEVGLNADTTKRYKMWNLSIWNKLSTNGQLTAFTTNNISLSLFYASSKNINGIAIGGMTIENKETINGVVIAGLNSRSSKVNGLQIGGLLSRAEVLNGIQIGAGNIADSSMKGLQIGGFNRSDKAKGLQMGIVNGTTSHNGLQIGFANGSEHLNGIQIGAVNETSELKGIQIGAGNYAKETKGLQIGFLNISDNNDYPIGAINIIKDGEKSVAISFDEMHNLISSFRSGGKVTYGIAGLGYNFKSPHNHLLLELGVGAHINIYRKFRIDTEVICDIFFRLNKPEVEWKKEEEKKKEKERSSKSLARLSYRILPSYQIHRNIRVFGGATFNYTFTGHPENTKMFSSSDLWRKDSAKSFKQLNLGWMFGAQYIF